MYTLRSTTTTSFFSKPLYKSNGIDEKECACTSTGLWTSKTTPACPRKEHVQALAALCNAGVSCRRHDLWSSHHPSNGMYEERRRKGLEAASMGFIITSAILG
jgi:hypothetical protein